MRILIRGQGDLFSYGGDLIINKLIILIKDFASIYRSGFIYFSILISLILLSLVGPLIYGVDPYQTSYVSKISVHMIDPLTSRLVWRKSLQDLVIRKTVIYENKLFLLDNSNKLYISDLDLGNIELIAKNISDLSINPTNNKIYVVTDNNKLCEVDRESLLYGSIKYSNCDTYDEEIISISSTENIMILLISSGVAIYNFSSDTHMIINISPRNISSINICGNYILLGSYSGDLLVVDLGNTNIHTQKIYRGRILDIICFGDRSYLLGERGVLITYFIETKSYNQIYLDTTRDLVHGIVYRDHIYVVDDLGTIFIVSPSGSVDELSIASLGNTKRIYVDDERRIYLIGYGLYAETLSSPSPRHLLGTDYLGRDLFAQIMIGIRVSLFIGALVSVIVLLIGSILGLLAGYFRGRVDLLISSFINFTYSIPLEPFAILLAMTIKPGLHTVVLAISLLIWRTTARIVRSQTIVVSSLPMVEAAKALGASHTRIIFKHILPMVAPIIMIDFANTLIYAVLAESTLSFIGVGPQNIFTLGSILNTAYVTGSWRIAWWTITPGIFIGLIIWSIYMIIRSLEPRFNPKLRFTQNQQI